jgi:hypothetical protein
MAISADNRWLYVANKHVAAGRGRRHPAGISVAKALTDPGHAVVATVRSWLPTRSASSRPPQLGRSS